MSRLTGRSVLGLSVLVTLGGILMSRPSSPAQEPRGGFAADRLPRTAAAPFDAQRALGYLKTICAFGPRVSGSDGMRRQQELLAKHFEEFAARITLQQFSARQISRRQPVGMANLIVSWHPDRPRRVILCAHYDTRPIADQEPDVRNWTKPFVGANDGASGVAFLMEMARHVQELPGAVGVDFVLFDGEEYIFEPEQDQYFFGSKHFAAAYRKEKPRHRYVAAVLLDMIAGKNPRFPAEANSWFSAGALVQDVWGIAGELKCNCFRPEVGARVEDDHIALNRAGIPAIDVIDFSYRHWHRLSDVPENCAPEGLEQVARVLGVWLQRVQ